MAIPLQRIKNVLMVTCGLPCLVLVVSVIVSYELDKRKDSLLLDNSLKMPVTVWVDEQQVATLAAAGVGSTSSERIHVARGSHVVVARDSDGNEVERVSLDVPEPPEDGTPLRALLCIGSKHRYALATAVYTSGDGVVEPKEGDGIRLLPLPTPLVMLPADVDILALDSLDKPFLRSTKMYGSDPVRVTHLCRLRAPEEDGSSALGCSGFFPASE